MSIGSGKDIWAAVASQCCILLNPLENRMHHFSVAA